jgi:hypothetical protein
MDTAERRRLRESVSTAAHEALLPFSQCRGRGEVDLEIKLEQMQARHRALQAQLESLDPTITGELPPRDQDRARGLLAGATDGDDNPDDAAMAPRDFAEYFDCPSGEQHGTGQSGDPSADPRRTILISR